MLTARVSSAQKDARTFRLRVFFFNEPFLAAEHGGWGRLTTLKNGRQRMTGRGAARGHRHARQLEKYADAIFRRLALSSQVSQRRLQRGEALGQVADLLRVVASLRVDGSHGGQ